jgi:hypothetical protein
MTQMGLGKVGLGKVPPARPKGGPASIDAAMARPGQTRGGLCKTLPLEKGVTRASRE